MSEATRMILGLILIGMAFKCGETIAGEILYAFKIHFHVKKELGWKLNKLNEAVKDLKYYKEEYKEIRDLAYKAYEELNRKDISDNDDSVLRELFEYFGEIYHKDSINHDDNDQSKKRDKND